MKNKGNRYVRPLRVYIGPHTKAEKSFRSQALMPEPEALAPGIQPSPDHNLVFHGGHTISDLVFTNFYVGGSGAWDPNDIQSIDQALAAAMSDQNLNNVMSQYYPSSAISSTFQDSQVLAGPKPQTV